MKQGDILVNKHGNKKKILGVCGEAYIVSRADIFDETDGIWIESEFNRFGYTLIQEPWEPKAGERFYYCDISGETEFKNWISDRYQIFILKIGNCFPYSDEGYKQAEAYREWLIKNKYKVS